MVGDNGAIRMLDGCGRRHTGDRLGCFGGRQLRCNAQAFVELFEVVRAFRSVSLDQPSTFRVASTVSRTRERPATG